MSPLLYDVYILIWSSHSLKESTVMYMEVKVSLKAKNTHLVCRWTFFLLKGHLFLVSYPNHCGVSTLFVTG